MKRLVPMLLTLVMVAGCGIGASSHQVTGSLIAPGHHENGFITVSAGERNAHCIPVFDDVSDGTQVTLLDESGKVIGLAPLRPDSPATVGESVPFACHYRFTFDSVPDTTFYRLVVGGYGGPLISKADLSEAGWQFAPLTLTIEGDLQ